MSVIRTTSVVALMLILAVTLSFSLPVLNDSSGIDNETIAELRASLNGTPKNLYVVRAVVYEIGILTEVDDNDTSFESQERVDLTFFDAHTNGSHIDLGNIPLPIQTNVSGQVLTGIAPVNIGAFSSPADLLATLPLTGSIVNITHSNTAYYKLTTSNVSSEDQQRVLTDDDLMKLPQIDSLFPSIGVLGGASTEAKSKESLEKLNSIESNED